MSGATPRPTGDRVVDLLAERRAVIAEQRLMTDPTAIALLGCDIERIDRERAEIHVVAHAHAVTQ